MKTYVGIKKKKKSKNKILFHFLVHQARKVNELISHFFEHCKVCQKDCLDWYLCVHGSVRIYRFPQLQYVYNTIFAKGLKMNSKCVSFIVRYRPWPDLYLARVFVRTSSPSSHCCCDLSLYWIWLCHRPFGKHRITQKANKGLRLLTKSKR